MVLRSSGTMCATTQQGAWLDADGKTTVTALQEDRYSQFFEELDRISAGTRSSLLTTVSLANLLDVLPAAVALSTAGQQQFELVVRDTIDSRGDLALAEIKAIIAAVPHPHGGFVRMDTDTSELRWSRSRLAESHLWIRLDHGEGPAPPGDPGHAQDTSVPVGYENDVEEPPGHGNGPAPARASTVRAEAKRIYLDLVKPEIIGADDISSAELRTVRHDVLVRVEQAWNRWQTGDSGMIAKDVLDAYFERMSSETHRMASHISSFTAFADELLRTSREAIVLLRDRVEEVDRIRPED